MVRTVVGANKGTYFAPVPVLLPTGKKGRVDMCFHRCMSESERSRHLVVELKRPRKLTMVEFSQFTNYASAITRHPQVVNSPHFWDFWLIGTQLEDALQDMRASSTTPGLVQSNPRFRLWVMDWGSLLDSAERRLQAVKAASTEDSGLRYVAERHAEFVPQQEAAGPFVVSAASRHEGVVAVQVVRRHT